MKKRGEDEWNGMEIKKILELRAKYEQDDELVSQ